MCVGSPNAATESAVSTTSFGQYLTYLRLVGNGGMGYNYNYYYYHSSIPY